VNVTEAYAALREGVAWLDASARARIVARGRDRARFLHNITSNDVKQLTPGGGCYAFLLNPQGRIQADPFLLCFEDRFLIGAEPELRERVIQHIRRYIIADQVELEDVSDRSVELAVEGPGAGAALRTLGAPTPQPEFSHAPWGDVLVVNATLTGQPGFRLILPAERKEAVIRNLESAGAVRANDADARLARIENGLPRYGEDIDDKSLPQETGRMNAAVSFSKGCYLGQEIVERVRARGHVNRKLELIELPGNELAPAGATIEIRGKSALVTSSVWSPRAGKAIALAYVRE
jgi:tRNA-modifying protein YgfZ